MDTNTKLSLSNVVVILQRYSSNLVRNKHIKCHSLAFMPAFEYCVISMSLMPPRKAKSRGTPSKFVSYVKRNIANCWDCNDFYIAKTKRRLRDRKTEHFKALTTNCHESAIADHVFLTNHRIKWDHFEILATGRSDMHCKIKESLLIRDLKPALNENVSSEKLYLYY